MFGGRDATRNVQKGMYKYHLFKQEWTYIGQLSADSNNGNCANGWSMQVYSLPYELNNIYLCCNSGGIRIFDIATEMDVAFYD